jgi:putative oxidoreductase
MTAMPSSSSLFAPSASRWTGRMLSILRIVAGAMFVTFGTMKLFGYPPSPVPMPPIPLASQMGIGAVLELVGGLLILVGLFTRPASFILAGEMAVAYFQFHFPQSVFHTTSNGVPAVLYCFLYLYLMFAGAGPWSVDAALARRRGGA